MHDNEFTGGGYPISEFEAMSSVPCRTRGTHFALVSVPVTVKPFAKTGRVSIGCGEPPSVQPGENCRGRIGDVCHFTISQMVKIEIPVDFGAVVSIGEARIDCGAAGVVGSSDTDCGCGD